MKNLTVNCATCDARFVSEKTLESYEQIRINCATMLTTPATRELMNQHQVSMNCATVLSLDADVKLVSINGKGEIRPADAVGGKKYLLVNGKALIHPGTEKVLEQYVGVMINGKVLCPESLSGMLGMMTINGKAVIYPDEAIVLEDTATIGKLFPLRAKNKPYWAAKRMIMTDPKLDTAKLAEKGATFCAPECILAESLVEALLPLIDEKADIQVVPDGTVVMDDDLELTESTLRRYGTKLYILSDARVLEEGPLEKMEYLHICGDASVAEAVEALFYEKAQAEGEIKILKGPQGRCLTAMPMVKITRWMLEKEPEGLTVADCALVKLDADVDSDMILEKLTFTDCALIRCTPEQEGAVAMVSTDVAQIGTDDGGMMGTLADAFSGQCINCAEYVL